MADRRSLGIVGFVFGSVTAAVMLIAVMVVKHHVDGRLTLDGAPHAGHRRRGSDRHPLTVIFPTTRSRPAQKSVTEHPDRARHFPCGSPIPR